jgi:hypothetical protein
MKAADQRALRQGISSLLDIIFADDVVETHATNGASAKEHVRNGAVARAG